MTRTRSKQILTLAALLLLLGALPAPAADNPYIVVTTTGERLKVVEKPAVQGKLATLLLFPDGARATLAVAKIDWAATERANAGPTPTPALTSWEKEMVKGNTGVKTLNKVAEGKKVDDEKAAARSGDYGKIKTSSGDSYAVATDGAGLAGNSVLKYAQLVSLTVDASACPFGSGAAVATFRNISALGLKSLKAIFLVARGPGGTSNRNATSVVSVSVPDLSPGAERTIRIYVDCSALQAAGMDAVLFEDLTGSAEQAYPYASGDVKPWPAGVPTPAPSKPTPQPARPKATPARSG